MAKRDRERDESWRSTVRRAGGVFTVAQALAFGFSRRQIEHRIMTHAWERLAGAGLRIAGTPSSLVPTLRAALLTWPDGVICGPSAAAYHGAPVDPQEVHVWVPTARGQRHGLVAHRYLLSPQDIIGVEGLRMTSAAASFRTSLALLPRREAESLGAWLIARRRTSSEALLNHVARFPGRMGNMQLRELSEVFAGGAAGPAERHLHQLLQEAGLTGWEANAPIRDGSRIIASADVLFRRAGLIIEVDGYAYHSDRVAFQRDRARLNRLVNLGYRVLRFTWADLTERPAQVVAEIRAALGRTGRH